MSSASSIVFAGTSGFSYPSWKPTFYPQKLPSTKFLEYYASRLKVVEVNYTFRQLAKAATFEKWVASTPDGFLFLPKAHNRITHTQRLRDAADFTRVFLDSLSPFREAKKLGPILFQLPPNLKCDLDLLSEFCRLLPQGYQYAFEFRNESWFSEDVYEILHRHNQCLCLAENEKLATPEAVTADFVYLRLRKPEYSDAELTELASRIDRYQQETKQIFALFKHEETPEGAFCAEKLLGLVSL